MYHLKRHLEELNVRKRTASSGRVNKVGGVYAEAAQSWSAWVYNVKFCERDPDLSS